MLWTINNFIHYCGTNNPAPWLHEVVEKYSNHESGLAFVDVTDSDWVYLWNGYLMKIRSSNDQKWFIKI